MRALLFLSIVLAVSGAYLGVTANCGKSTGAPPVVLPAPTAGNITVTAPDADGNVRVIGETGAVAANAEVTVTNLSRPLSIVVRAASSCLSATTTADADGAFEAEIAASVGDTITVSYVDPATNEESEALETTVPADVIPTGAKEFNIYDAALGAGATAYIVSNDGTNSEITVVNMVSKETTRYQFAGKLFDLIAVSAGIGYAAVIDSTNGNLYWYNLARLSDDATPISVTNPTNVSIADYSGNELFSGVVLVTREDSSLSISFFSIVSSDNSLREYESRCFGIPEEGTTPHSCGERSPHVKTIGADMYDTGGGSAEGLAIATYEDGSWYYHWFYLPPMNSEYQLMDGESGYSAPLTGAQSPSSVRISDSIGVVTDSLNNTLYKLSWVDDALTPTSITVGSSPMDVAVDTANYRAFVSNAGDDTISVVDIENATVSSTTIEAKFAPGALVYDSTKNLLGVVLTGSNALGIISPP